MNFHFLSILYPFYYIQNKFTQLLLDIRLHHILKTIRKKKINEPWYIIDCNNLVLEEDDYVERQRQKLRLKEQKVKTRFETYYGDNGINDSNLYCGECPLSSNKYYYF